MLMLRWSYDKMLIQSKLISFLARKKSAEVEGEEAEKKLTTMKIILTTSGSGGYVVLWWS